MALRFLSFSKVIPLHPSDHLQVMSSFDHPLFYSMNTVPLYDILAATCEVEYHCFVRLLVSLPLLRRAVVLPDGLLVYGCAPLCTAKVFISVVYEEIMQRSQSPVKT